VELDVDELVENLWPNADRKDLIEFIDFCEFLLDAMGDAKGDANFCCSLSDGSNSDGLSRPDTDLAPKATVGSRTLILGIRVAL
jgi:hypothetical protein